MQRQSATEKQLAANQANARKSTGPRSETGKATSSRNRTTHGFTCGAFILFEHEDQEEYETLVVALHTTHQPETEMEDMLVIKLAQHHWLQQRALQFQTKAFDEPTQHWHERNLMLYMRYHSQHERAFNKILQQLKELQDRRRDELYQVHLNGITKQHEETAIRQAKRAILEDKADQAKESHKAREKARQPVTPTPSATPAYESRWLRMGNLNTIQTAAPEHPQSIPTEGQNNAA